MPHLLHQQLRQLAAGEHSVYHDTYYDHPDKDLTASGRELRLRTMQTHGQQQSLLTYKEPAVDAASGSKPEHETEIASPAAVDATLRGVGFEYLVTFEKHCTNYRFAAQGRNMLATVVTVPELVRQPDFVIFMFGCAFGSGWSWRGAGGRGARLTSAAGV